MTTQDAVVPKVGPDPWSQWNNRGHPVAQLEMPHSFQIHGQHCDNPPAFGQRAPTLRFTHHATEHPDKTNQCSSPLGAAIHAEPAGQPLETIPIEDFDKDKWKLSQKHFDKDVAKFDGETANYRNWWNRVRDHIIGNHHPWGRLLDDKIIVCLMLFRDHLTFLFDNLGGASLRHHVVTQVIPILTRRSRVMS